MKTRITELREQRGLSQGSLADLVGLKDNTICQYETGKRTPNIYVLIKLADIFGVTIDYLIKRSDRNNVNSSKE